MFMQTGKRFRLLINAAFGICSAGYGIPLFAFIFFHVNFVGLNFYLIAQKEIITTIFLSAVRYFINLRPEHVF